MELISIKGQKPIGVYQNFLFFSVADEDNKKEGFPTDLLCRGNVGVLTKGLVEMMERHNVFASILTGAVALYFQEHPDSRPDLSHVTNK